MARPRISRCRLCDTKLCAVIVFFKCVIPSIIFDSYPKRWERSLPAHQRAEQRKKRKNIQFYKMVTAGLATIHVFVGMLYKSTIIEVIISVIAKIVYLFSFWYVTQGQEEFSAQSYAWHSGKKCARFSRIRITEHVKVIVTVISVAEFLAVILIKFQAVWFFATILQFSSCYFFLSQNVSQLFPQRHNNDYELVYRRKRKRMPIQCTLC